MTRLGQCTAHRFGVNQSRLIAILRERLAARVIRGIADIAAEAIWRLEVQRSLCKSSFRFRTGAAQSSTQSIYKPPVAFALEEETVEAVCG